MIKVDVSNVISEKEIEKYQARVSKVNKMIDERTGPGNDFLGWSTWPTDYDKEELERLLKDAQYVRDNFDVLVVAGIGGSYLGAKCALDALKGVKGSDKPEIIFMGQTFSPNYTHQVLEYLKDKNFAINVISKSGTTTETSIAFRLLKDLLERKVGKAKAQKAIYAVTDKARGALKTLCNQEGYSTYVLPDDIGGRYSVLTPVGLFPLAVAGVDVKAMLEGAAQGQKEFDNDDLKNNKAYRYAVSRDYMLRNGHPVEMFVTYEPQMSQLSEWLKQLFGESEGKEKKGLLPTSATFSTDLHSLGQFIQDGTPLLFETIVNVVNPLYDVEIPSDKDDLDGLNYLAGKKLSYVNQMAYQGTLKAHEEDGGVPCNIITIEKLDAKTLGYLFYFFMRTCAMSAYLLDINPFNQPGVEIYKKNMFHLLGKKGY